MDTEDSTSLDLERLVDGILERIVVRSGYDSRIPLRDLENVLPKGRPREVMQTHLPTAGEVARYLADEFQMRSCIQPPKTLGDLQHIFSEYEPHDCLMCNGLSSVLFGSGQPFDDLRSPFPSSMVKGISQGDVDTDLPPWNVSHFPS